MKYGFIEDILDATAYLLGTFKVPYIPYQEDGNWEKYLPKYEPQAENFETNGCTVWGTQNQIEILHKRLYDIEPNYAERFTYLLTPVNPDQGVDPHRVYECIRRYGLISYDLLPVPDTREAFLKNDITKSLLERGQYWLSKNDFKYEWLWRSRPDNWKEILKDALKTSPIGVSVTAWRQENGLYVSDNGGNNHWCVLFKIDSKGVMHVFDSYDHSIKKLHPEHNIRRASRIWLNRKTLTSLTKHKSILQVILERLMNKKNLVQVCEEHIGIDASPSDLAPDELGCAETTTTLLKKVYPETPIITGTWTLYDYLKNPKNGWELTTVPQPGCVVISPTGMSPKKGAIGHAGIVLNDGVIASNDSKTGKFLKNFTTLTWIAYFQRKLLFPIYYFKRR